MIKVAIAGTNGLAQYIANLIATQTYHQFIILSRNVGALCSSPESLTNVYEANPGLTNKGWQVLQTDYNNASDLRFKLAGVDTVISTISGNAQLNLIDAAAAAHVRRFAPSEFEGSPSTRPANDVLDNRRRAALARLQQYEAQGMRYTVFTCGIFYERFGPGGMAASQIGVSSNIGQEGEYIMDLRGAKAQLPFYNEAGQPVYVCMTSARDVARFVVAALSLASWPREFRMRGDRMSVSDLVNIGEQLRGLHYSMQNVREEILTRVVGQVVLSSVPAIPKSHCRMS
jgi:hypothetical protein